MSLNTGFMFCRVIPHVVKPAKMAQIEYDDSGSTTFYFILSIYLLVLLPVSYILLPKKKKQKGDGGCEGVFGVSGTLEHDFLFPRVSVYSYVRGLKRAAGLLRSLNWN